jgi:hypothetical protein
VERTFVLDKRECALGVTDILVGVGLHDVVGRIHLPDGAARLRAPKPEELARALRVPEAPKSFELMGVELGPAEAPEALVLFATGLEPRLEPSRYSPGYGLVVPSQVVVFRGRVAPPAWLRWVVVFN